MTYGIITDQRCLQIIDVYRQMIPQFDQFINQLQAEDREALKAKYSL